MHEGGEQWPACVNRGARSHASPLRPPRRPTTSTGSAGGAGEGRGRPSPVEPRQPGVGRPGVACPRQNRRFQLVPPPPAAHRQLRGSGPAPEPEIGLHVEISTSTSKSWSRGAREEAAAIHAARATRGACSDRVPAPSTPDDGARRALHCRPAR